MPRTNFKMPASPGPSDETLQRIDAAFEARRNLKWLEWGLSEYDDMHAKRRASLIEQITAARSQYERAAEKLGIRS